MLFDEALRYLLGLGHETLAMKLGLRNTERLLESLGQPQNKSPKVQIAGTNGKGSTAIMLDAICRAANIRTGLYTSPHLVSITERIRIGGQEITRHEFAHLTARVRQAAQDLCAAGVLPALPTFFEQVTAIALVCFGEAPVQLMILETGLGGRLDATTAARAEVAAITPISLDHQEYLGHTLAEIAAEKAAIIRPGMTAAIIAPQPPEALAVILRHCEACGVRPRLAGGGALMTGADETGRPRVTFKTGQEQYTNIRLGLRGRHQLTNAVLAVEVAEALRELGFDISRANMTDGLRDAQHAGRLELRPGTPPILLDGAHNAEGARALRDYLDEFAAQPLTLVFGAMRDKDVAGIASLLFPIARCLILTSPANSRAMPVATLARAVPFNFNSSRITHAASADEALRAAREQTPPDGLICITGSLYLVGEILSVLREPKDA